MAKSSAQKQAVAAERKRQSNKSTRTEIKTKIDAAERLISSHEVEAAKKAAVDAVSALDKAAAKKIIHGNNSARRKSRLLKKLNQAGSAAK